MQQQIQLHRVKVYKLNEGGGWDDKGTGLVSVEPLPLPVRRRFLTYRSTEKFMILITPLGSGVSPLVVSHLLAKLK